MLPSMSD